MVEMRKCIRDRLQCAMDAVAGLLDGPRARGAFLLRSSLDPPWSLRIQDEAPLTAGGGGARPAWIVPDERRAGARCAPATSRSCAGPTPYIVADDPATPPQAIIHPGQRCTTPDGRELEADEPSACAPGATAPTAGRCCSPAPTSSTGEISRPPAARAAAAARARARRAGTPADRAARRRDRQGRAGPGGGAGPAARPAADRRAARLVRAPEAEAPGWYRAYARPGRRARRCGCCTTTPRTRGPSRRWRTGAGVSRAALARRFTDLVGEPPMAFLTGWRIALAADLLLEPGATVGSVARAGRLRQPVRAQHRVQAPARDEPAAVPRRRDGMRRDMAARRSRAGTRRVGAAGRSGAGARRAVFALAATIALAAVLAASAGAGARCFGAAARDPEHRCANPRLARVVTPTPDEALLDPNFPCTKRKLTPAATECAFGAPAERATATVALIGDSHAQHWRSALAVQAERRGWRVLDVSGPLCMFSTATTGPARRSTRRAASGTRMCSRGWARIRRSTRSSRRASGASSSGPRRASRASTRGARARRGAGRPCRAP